MDFTLSREHEMLRKMHCDFAQNEVKPLAAELDEEERFPKETIPKLARLGMLGIPFPTKYGGAGADTELTIAKCGYQELRDKGISVIDLKQKENARCTVDIENSVVFDKINTWELVRDCDAIITVPVMKAYDQTEVTLGMKNLKGLLIDTQKKDFHKKGLIEGVVDWCLHRRYTLERTESTLHTPMGDVRCKTSTGCGVTRTKYEYEDLAYIARENGLSLAEAEALINGRQ